jgi:hypothetical protein
MDLNCTFKALNVSWKLWWNEKHLHRYWESNNVPPLKSLFTRVFPVLLKLPVELHLSNFLIRSRRKVEVFSEPVIKRDLLAKHVMTDLKLQRHVLLQATGLLVLCTVSILFLARTVHSNKLCEDILKKCKERCKVLVDSDCEIDEEFIPAKSPCNCCAYCVPKVRK